MTWNSIIAAAAAGVPVGISCPDYAGVAPLTLVTYGPGPGSSGQAFIVALSEDGRRVHVQPADLATVPSVTVMTGPPVTGGRGVG